MAYHGIAECFGLQDKWFTGVVVTNGAGSPRSGIYGDYTDEEMQKVRLVEQRKAAYVGEYACQIQLGFTSAAGEGPAGDRGGATTWRRFCAAAQPEVRLPAQPGRQARYPRRRGPARHRRAARGARRDQAEEGLRLRSVARPGLAAGRGQAGAAGFARAPTSPRRWWAFSIRR